MGVFSYSVHVQHSDLDSVIDAIRAVMDERGFRENLDKPRDSWDGVDVNRLYEQAIRGPKQNFAFYFSQTNDGWTSLLSRNQWDMQPVLVALSVALDTRVLSCYVHDSDFWEYKVHVGGACSDYFNSDRARLTQDDILRMLVSGQEGEVLEDFPQLSGPARKLGRLLAKRRPADLRKFEPYVENVWDAIDDNLLSEADWERYKDWGVAEAKSILASFPGEFPESLWKLEKEPSERFTCLRPVLRPEVAEAEFVACLQRHDAFSDKTLECFLQLCGIASHFAHVDYESVGRRGEETLAKHGIAIAQHLEFKGV